MAQPSQQEIKQELVDAIRMLEHAEYIDHNGHCSVRRDANSFYINSGASMRACADRRGHRRGRSRRQAGRRRQRQAAAGIPDPRRGLSRAAEDQRRVPHPSAMVDLSDHDRPSAEGGVCAGVAARRHAGDELADVGQHPRDGREDGRHHGRQPGGDAQGPRRGRGRRERLECFAYAAYVEENARRQYMAMQIGDPYVFSDEEQAACRQKLRSPSLFKKTWDHYRSKIS